MTMGRRVTQVVFSLLLVAVLGCSDNSENDADNAADTNWGRK